MSFVVAACAGLDAREIGSVDVDRDSRRVGNVAHAVDVARRRETADVADLVLIGGEQVQVGVEPLLVLDALYDAQDAPDDVVVDAGDLPGPADQGYDREQRTAAGRSTAATSSPQGTRAR